MTEGLIRLDQATHAAVASGRLVHLATINPDGTPQVTCTSSVGKGTRSSQDILRITSSYEMFVVIRGSRCPLSPMFLSRGSAPTS